MTLSPGRFTRRAWLQSAAAGAAIGAAMPGRADPSNWLSTWVPYAPSPTKTLMPRITGTRASELSHFMATHEEVGYRRIEPRRQPARQPTLTQTVPLNNTISGKFMRTPPTAYVLTAQRSGVPAWLLFGVALQESQLAFGREMLPYPWTLCVAGRGERHATYEQTLAALSRYVRAGLTNVDCGAMQVNWYWHKDRLGSFALALDPYPNLAAGASILRDHYKATGHWATAIGLYHTGSFDSAGRRIRAQGYATSVIARLRRLGVDVKPFLV